MKPPPRSYPVEKHVAQERNKPKGKGRVKFNEDSPLDPMDPASYSDIPR